jgi:hypothetical protein
MAKLVNRISDRFQPIFSAAGLKGAKIGTIGEGVVVTVDEDRTEKDDLKRAYAPIVGPDKLGPTWLRTKKQGWIELANTKRASEDVITIITKIDARTGDIISCVRVE